MFVKLLFFRQLKQIALRPKSFCYNLMLLYRVPNYGTDLSNYFIMYSKLSNYCKCIITNSNTNKVKKRVVLLAPMYYILNSNTYCSNYLNLSNNLFRFYESILFMSRNWWTIFFFFLIRNPNSNGNVLNINWCTPHECECFTDVAVSSWTKGNIALSINQFILLYEKGDNAQKKKLMRVLEGLIFSSIEKDGMVVVKNIVLHVKQFCIEKNELSLMVTLWYSLFTSHLFEDNCVSNTLLNNSNFKQHLKPLIPYFGANFLKNDEVRLYQRLVETTLCYNMDNAAGILLRLLFDYYYKRGYFEGCYAVYNCCKELNVQLTSDQTYKHHILKKTGMEMKSKLLKILPPKDFTYKF